MLLFFLFTDALEHARARGSGEDDYFIIKLNPIPQEPEPDPPSPGGIPGFSVDSILIGLVLGVIIIWLSRSRVTL